jgi:hypothetical protein
MFITSLIFARVSAVCFVPRWAAVIFAHLSGSAALACAVPRIRQ